MKAYALKAHIREQGCDLNRIGRSRNWILKANFDQLQTIIAYIELTGEPSWMWLTKLLKSKYQHLSHDELLRIASTIEAVTISALTARSDCTIAQARQVIDELEELD